MIRSFIYSIVYWPIFVMILAIMYPITKLSKKGSYPALLTYRLLTKWTLLCQKYIIGIDYKVSGLERVKNNQVIIGCNHQSSWETFIFSILLDNFAMVIKQELLKKPLAGIYFEKLACIPIDRSSPVKAIKTLLKYGKEAYLAGKSIVIFPNGTRASINESTEYKSGIYALYKALNIPVVPATVNSGKFWPRNSFKKSPGIIELRFKEQISPGLSKEEFFEQFSKAQEQSVNQIQWT
ncbi:MAG: 1-acyl-sn-glycerol-3-phosphate acyltransferase [Alphaproteobacteria bacterium]|nr:1-acyl-sn-glycerol-3-phosphate acyltransferase [Alphaproteobacteria bacterium]